MTLIAEDLLLLLLDDESGALDTTGGTAVAYGGAVLAELALMERVVVAEPTGRLVRTAKVTAVGSPPADPLLAAAHALVAEKPRTPADLVSRIGKDLKDQLVARLVERGIVREEKDRALGIFPRTRWPAVDSTHERDVRRTLDAVLVQGLDPDPRTGALVALLSALGVVHKVVDHPGLSNAEIRKRAKTVAEGEWAAKGVADAVAAANAAVMGAIVASTVVTTTTT